MIYLFSGLDSIGDPVMDSIADVYATQPFMKYHFSEVTLVNVQDYRVILMKPTTLNFSKGRSFMEMTRKYNTWAGQTTIFHEDPELEPETIRILSCEDLGDHPGLKSIYKDIGVGFRRVAIGKPDNLKEFATRITESLPLLLNGEHTHYIHSINP